MDLKNTLRTQWTEAAQDWIGQDQAVRTGMLDSWMLDALGNVRGKRALDIGCGEGRFSRLLAGLGAEVTGIDLTEPLIERARSLAVGGDSYVMGDAETLNGIADESFDLAVSYIVLVDLLDYRASIEAAYRVLKPGGRFIVCNVHPMRSAVPYGWVNLAGRKLFYAVDDYWDEGPRDFPWWDKNFVNMHRTLSSYVKAFLDTGFVLEGLDEPVPSEEQLVENPSFNDEFRSPNFVVFVLRKPAV